MSDSSSSPTRRTFIKKSLAGVFIASQPLVLTGLLRATGEGVGDYKQYETTVDWYLTFSGFDYYDDGMDYGYVGNDGGDLYYY
ncbi:MAG: hypothetical protein WCK77_17870 [Verrucomicrobiota bacterium]